MGGAAQTATARVLPFHRRGQADSMPNPTSLASIRPARAGRCAVLAGGARADARLNVVEMLPTPTTRSGSPMPRASATPPSFAWCAVLPESDLPTGRLTVAEYEFPASLAQRPDARRGRDGSR